LEALHILWAKGPSTVREVMDAMSRDLAYTTVMTLLNVMHDKKPVSRKPEGRAFRYAARFKPDQTQRTILPTCSIACSTAPLPCSSRDCSNKRIRRRRNWMRSENASPTTNAA
jgi:penicillinase repressor